ncbi:MAG: LptA/OstA family protein [Candidatus Omnitrophica bacterium]|nr:LptA/OstA family protein [Candidatus Omnitrophota bacterium]MDD5771041.1 LptA/OstA family protein [Candidatus Omnitrophota bacterium]
MPNRFSIFIRLSFLASFLAALFFCINPALAAENKESPIIINGDNVEYSADNKEVVATGNIEVIYKGSKLTCNKMKVNMQAKEGVAEGNARLEDNEGVVTGERIVYDFANKTGIIYNADFRANPYFGKSRKVEKVSDNEFVAKNGYFTTCSYDHPHFRLAAKRINMFPGDKVRSRQTTLYLGAVPVLYLPQFNYSMKEPIMHVQVEPGKRKDWGPYVLSAWRYNLTDKLNAKLFLDYRSKLGWGEGFELNYVRTMFGKGDFKLYYANEEPNNPPAGSPSQFQRYFMRWRHKWDIDQRTNFIAEFYKIGDKRRKYEPDHNIMKDYFFREYEKDSEPLSYALFHHSFNYSSVDILLQKRTNNWFDQLDKMPEISYSMPSLQLGDSPLYFEDFTQFGSYNKKATTAPVTTDNVSSTRLDTSNTLSLPMKLSIIRFRPFVSSRQTLYDKGANGEHGIVRTIFSSGADMSTKFFRIYHAKTNFLGLDINDLRHIITPSVGYLYTHTPTIPISNIKQIDDVDAIHRGNTATLSLSNKLQTKRKGVSVDFVDLLITTDYVIDPKTGDNGILTPKQGESLKSDFSDILFKLKVLPYSWMRFESEATFEHSDRSNTNYNKFSLINYSMTFDLGKEGKERSFSLGQRYERKGKNEISFGFDWRFTPKWKFRMYQRYNFKQTTTLDSGSQEQEYTITRDLHCWELDVTLNRKEDTGTTVFFTFRLKAFPENEFGFDQTVSEQKSGAQ